MDAARPQRLAPGLARPVGGPEHVDVGGEVLHLAAPPDCARQHGGAEVGDVVRGEATRGCCS
jgi:hypothetical protein